MNRRQRIAALGCAALLAANVGALAATLQAPADQLAHCQEDEYLYPDRLQGRLSRGQHPLRPRLRPRRQHPTQPLGATMTRKDYIAIAAALRPIQGGLTAALALVPVLQADNPRFDADRFLKAAGA